MGEIFLNNNHLGDWIVKAEDLRTARGTSQALHYLIGEKFFNMVSLYRSFMDELPVNSPDIQHLSGDGTHTGGPHDSTLIAVNELEEMLSEFAALINQSFEPYVVRGFFSDILCVGTTLEISDRPGGGAELPPVWNDMMKYLSVV
jgi:hypothetical protein